MPNPELSNQISRVSGIRERAIQQAKEKGPSAAFHVALVRMNQAIEQAHAAHRGGDADETAAALKQLREFDDVADKA